MSKEIHNKDAEQSVLGSVFMGADALPIIETILNLDDFLFTENRILYSAVCDLSKQKIPVDFVVVRDYLKSRGQLDAIGGCDYLVHISQFMPTAANAEYYAKIVKEHSARRQISSIATSIISRCIQPEDSNSEQIRLEAIKDLNEIYIKSDGDFQSLEDAFSGITFDGNNNSYINSGFHELDKKTIGLGKGQVVIVAGRPGMGKSSFMSSIAINCAKKGKKVLFYSMEMNAQDIGLRMACAETGTDLQAAIKCRWLTDQQKENLKLGIDEIRNLPIYFDCKSLSTNRLRASVMSTVRQGNVDVVFVDYLGLIRSGSGRERSRYESVSQVSNDLKEIALDSNIPMVVGCQLSRANESRTDRRPQLSDLRDSGSIEQDADIVLFLHRPAYYQKPDDEENYPPELCECIIAKNRRGPTDIVELGFRATTTFFYNPAGHVEEGEISTYYLDRNS